MAGDCRTLRAPCHLSPMQFHAPVPAPNALLRRFLVTSIGRVLVAWMLQLHRNLHLRLIDLVIFAEGLEMRRQHLHSQRAIRNSIDASLPLGIRLQIHLSTFLFTFALHRMQYHLRIPQRLPVGVAHHYKLQAARRPAVILSPNQSAEAKGKHHHHRQQNIFSHKQSHPTLLLNIVARSLLNPAPEPNRHLSTTIINYCGFWSGGLLASVGFASGTFPSEYCFFGRFSFTVISRVGLSIS